MSRVKNPVWGKNGDKFSCEFTEEALRANGFEPVDENELKEAFAKWRLIRIYLDENVPIMEQADPHDTDCCVLYADGFRRVPFNRAKQLLFKVHPLDTELHY